MNRLLVFVAAVCAATAIALLIAIAIDDSHRHLRDIDEPGGGWQW